MQIMHYLGASYFQRDIRRLTISKQWFYFAATSCFQNIDLTPKKLRRLLASKHTESVLSHLRNNLELLSITFYGFDQCNLEANEETSTHGKDESYWIGEAGRAELAAWTVSLNNDIVKVSDVLKDCQKLQEIHIVAANELNPLLLYLPRRDYLFASVVHNLISIKHLTVLKLDLHGTSLVTPNYQNNLHICTSIGALLTTLKRLQLRMCSICADVLRPQDPYIRLRLQEVVINLCLYSSSSTITAAKHSVFCRQPNQLDRPNFNELRVSIEDQAKALAAQMSSPKVVRVLTQKLPLSELQSLNILNGKVMVLSDGMAWEDDGATEEDSDPESDITEFLEDNMLEAST